MAVTLDVIRRLTIQAQAQGVAEVKAQLDALSTAQSNVEKSAAGMGASHTVSGQSMLSAGKQVDALEKRVVPMVRANADLERGQRLVTAALSQGSVSTERAAALLAALGARHAAASKAVNDNTASLHGNSAAHGLNRNQMLESVHVAKAFIDQIAAGQDPLRALALESGRIGQIFASGSGGIAGTLQGFGSAIAGLLSPTILLGGAITVLGGAGIYAYAAFSSGQDKLARSLEGTGRAAGVTLAELNKIAEAGAAQGHISLGSAQGLAGTFAQTGALSGGQIAPLVALAKDYARVTGVDLPKAGERLAEAFKDPAKGALGLNKELGFLDAATLLRIEHLRNLGDLEGAQNVLLQAAAPAIAGVTDRTWSLSKAWEAATRSASDYLSATGKFIERQVNGPDDRERLRAVSGPFTGGFGGARFAGDDEKAAFLREKIARGEYAESVTTGRRGAEERRAAESLAVQPIVDRNNTEAESYRKLVEDRTRLNKALADGIDLGPGAAGALERLNLQVRNFTTANQRAAQDGELAVKAIEASTASEKLAVDVERSLTQARRAGVDAVGQSIAAENARNEAIARANSEARKTLEQSKDRLSLVGLTPFEKSLKEIDFRYRDLVRNNVLSGGDKGGLAVSQPAAIASGSGGNVSFLRLKGAESTAGGATNDNVLKIASAIQSADIAGGFGRFTAFNDNFHKGTSSAHARGLAGDFTIDDPSQSARAAEQVRQILRERGLAGRVIDEYSSPSARATGGHIHYQLDGDGSAPASLARTASTSGANFAGARTNERTAALREFTDVYLKDAGLAVERQNAALRLQVETYGQSAGAIAKTTEAQKLLAYFTEQHIPINDKIRDSIAGIAAKAGVLAQAGADFEALKQKQIAGLDGIRSAGTEILGGVAHALADGKDPGKALKGALAGIGGKLIDSGVGGISDGLFGQQGKPGGGLFGDLFGGLLGGGAADKTIRANVVNVQGPLGGGGIGGLLGGGQGAAGGGGGGILGSIFGGIFGGVTNGSGGIGHNAEGTDNWPGGPTWVGERGPELLNLPGGSQIVPNHIAARSGGGGKVQNIAISGGDVIIHGNVTADIMPQVRAEIAASQAQLSQNIKRNFAAIQSESARNYTG